MKMTANRTSLCEDAKAAGYRVVEADDLITIVKTHKGHGGILRGLNLYSCGTAIALATDLGIAKGMRSFADMRAHLGLK